MNSRRSLTNHIWFERRQSGGGDWQRIEPDPVRYRLARFADQRGAGARVAARVGAGAATFVRRR